MRGEVLSVEECQHDFFKKGIERGVLIQNKSVRTIEAVKLDEDRYNYRRERYGNTLLNFMCGYFDENENSLLRKYWCLLHGISFPSYDDEGEVPLTEKAGQSIILCGKVDYIRDARMGTLLSVVTKVSYTKLDGTFYEDSSNTKCIIPEKESRSVWKEIRPDSYVFIKGHFRLEKGYYRFFGDDLNIIVDEYRKLDTNGVLMPENGDENFFIERSETVCDRYLNKVIITGNIVDIGLGVIRGYPHMLLSIRTKSDVKDGYLDIPVDVWEKHHKNCLKDICIGHSIWIEGYFKHPICQRYYYSYEPVDAAVFAYKYKILG